jgi:hypothetical protein
MELLKSSLSQPDLFHVVALRIAVPNQRRICKLKVFLRQSGALSQVLSHGRTLHFPVHPSKLPLQSRNPLKILSLMIRSFNVVGYERSSAEGPIVADRTSKRF